MQDEDAGAARSGVVEVNGTVLFVERFGHGRPVLIIHGAGEDCGMLRPQSRALAAAGFQVVSYDRRGTGHSGRDAWPGDGAGQHARDAAALISLLGLHRPHVLGLSSGAVVALALAVQAPDQLGTVVAWEPPAAGVLPDGTGRTAQLMHPVDQHLHTHPGDYIGAQAVLLGILTGNVVRVDDPSFARVRVNAEPMVRDDPRITVAPFPSDLSGLGIRVAVGSEPNPLVAAAVDELARRCGRPPVRVPAAHHEVYLDRPDVLAEVVASLVRQDGPTEQS